MKVKIEVKSWNNYPPPPTHTPREGGGGRGLIRLTLHPRTIIHGCEIVQWDQLIPKVLIVSENKSK